MVFRDTTYSCLVISSNEEFNSRIASLLPASEYWPVTYASSGSSARRKILEGHYDLILINSPLRDESGIRLAEGLSSDPETGILLFVKKEFYDEIYSKVYEKGMVVLSKPASLQLVRQSVRILVSVKERMNRMKAKQATVEDKIAEIRLMNRAKWALIENEHLSEQEAHHRIEHLAMDERISKKQAAEKILRQYSDK